MAPISWGHVSTLALALMFQQLPAAADSSSPLNCTVTRQPDGLFRYQLSTPPRSNCKTCWEDHKKIVVAHDSDHDAKLVKAQTNQSLILKVCLHHLHYTRDCSGAWEETRCEVNCSHLDVDLRPATVNSTLICLAPSWCVNKMNFGLAIGLPVLALAVLGGVLYIVCHKCRRRLQQPVFYTSASPQIKIEQ